MSQAEVSAGVIVLIWILILDRTQIHTPVGFTEPTGPRYAGSPLRYDRQILFILDRIHRIITIIIHHEGHEDREKSQLALLGNGVTWVCWDFKKLIIASL